MGDERPDLGYDRLPEDPFPMTSLVLRQTPTDQAVGMTLDELREFVDMAKAIGIPWDTQVLVRIGWSGQIKKIAAGGRP